MYPLSPLNGSFVWPRQSSQRRAAGRKTTIMVSWPAPRLYRLWLFFKKKTRPVCHNWRHSDCNCKISCHNWVSCDRTVRYEEGYCIICHRLYSFKSRKNEVFCARPKASFLYCLLVLTIQACSWTRVENILGMFMRRRATGNWIGENLEPFRKISVFSYCAEPKKVLPVSQKVILSANPGFLNAWNVNSSANYEANIPFYLRR